MAMKELVKPSKAIKELIGKPSNNAVLRLAKGTNNLGKTVGKGWEKDGSTVTDAAKANASKGALKLANMNLAGACKGALDPSQVEASIIADRGGQPPSMRELGLSKITMPYVNVCANGHRASDVFSDGSNVYCPVCGEKMQPRL